MKKTFPVSTKTFKGHEEHVCVMSSFYPDWRFFFFSEGTVKTTGTNYSVFLWAKPVQQWLPLNVTGWCVHWVHWVSFTQWNFTQLNSAKKLKFSPVIPSHEGTNHVCLWTVMVIIYECQFLKIKQKINKKKHGHMKLFFLFSMPQNIM